LTLGAFFESGWGSYDSTNTFDIHAPVYSEGDTSYFGGGILGRYNFTCSGGSVCDGLYVDGSARIGRSEMDFDTKDIMYFGTHNAQFSSDALYYGLHGGIGYAAPLSSVLHFDLSAKVIWLHQRGDDVNVHGDAVHFQEADSIRTRIGGRLAYKAIEYVVPYAGVYWEQEYDGALHSSVNGQRIDTPDIAGATGVGELGISFRPEKVKGLSLDIWVRGYTGTREGATGNMQFKYEF
jgi:outer membrane autotransporter barrel domain